MANEQVNVPSLVVILVLSGLVIRYLFFSPSLPRPQRDPRSAVREREAAVETIQQMFPQLDRRTILWDLQRTHGDISATTERILAGRIQTPPVTFQPPPPLNDPTPTTASPGLNRQQSTPAAADPSPPTEPDLITRYNLCNKLASADTDAADETRRETKGWSSNREERQMLLQKRRDEMILAARRKMEAKLRGNSEHSDLISDL